MLAVAWPNPPRPPKPPGCCWPAGAPNPANAACCLGCSFTSGSWPPIDDGRFPRPAAWFIPKAAAPKDAGCAPVFFFGVSNPLTCGPPKLGLKGASSYDSDLPGRPPRIEVALKGPGAPEGAGAAGPFLTSPRLERLFCIAGGPAGAGRSPRSKLSKAPRPPKPEGGLPLESLSLRISLSRSFAPCLGSPWSLRPSRNFWTFASRCFCEPSSALEGAASWGFFGWPNPPPKPAGGAAC